MQLIYIYFKARFVQLNSHCDQFFWLSSYFKFALAAKQANSWVRLNKICGRDFHQVERSSQQASKAINSNVWKLLTAL